MLRHWCTVALRVALRQIGCNKGVRGVTTFRHPDIAGAFRRLGGWLNRCAGAASSEPPARRRRSWATATDVWEQKAVVRSIPEHGDFTCRDALASHSGRPSGIAEARAGVNRQGRTE